MRWLLLAGLLAAGCGGVKEEVKPSRAPRAGCAWKPFEDRKLGLSVLVQECEGATARVWRADGNALWEGTAQGEAAKGMPVIEVFEKPAEQPVEQAIRERFVAALPGEQRGGCVVRADGERWKIVPAGEYLAKARQTQATEPGTEVCGANGEIEAVTYFEYRPAGSRTKYWFVRAGQGSPLFDEQSIRVK